MLKRPGGKRIKLKGGMLINKCPSQFTTHFTLITYRAKEKEKNKIKRAKRKLEDPSLDSLHSLRKKLKDATMANSNCHVGLVIDLSFDDLMDEKSMASCIKQILRCYSINRRAQNPVQFHVTGLSGKSLSEMSKHNGFTNWDVS